MRDEQWQWQHVAVIIAAFAWFGGLLWLRYLAMNQALDAIVRAIR